MLTTIEFIEAMIPLYLMVVLGFFARKKQLLSKHANEVFTQLLLYITLPSLIIVSLNTSFSLQLLSDFFWLLAMSFWQMTIAIFLAYWAGRLSKLPPDRQSVYESLIIFGNQGFLGLALSNILAGGQGIVYVSFFNLIYLVLIWTYGIYLFTKEKKKGRWKLLFYNPGIIATTVGLFLLFTPLQLPASLTSMLDSVGQMTVPLSMLLIGSMLADLPLGDLLRLLKDPYVWSANLYKLLIIPSFLSCFIFFKLPIVLLTIAILTAAMPSAATTTLYAQKFGGDPAFSSVSVLLSHLLCLFTIPILYSLLRLLLVNL